MSRDPQGQKLERGYDLPVVEYLASQNMPSKTPDILVPLLHQPLMAQVLRVEVMHLKRTVVYMWLRDRAVGRQTRDEKRMMINQILSTINVSEHRNFLSLTVRQINIKHVRRHDVEVLRIPFHQGGELFRDETEVTELVNRRWTGLEALKLALAGFRRFVVHEELSWHLLRFWCCLAVDEVYWEAFWVKDGDDVAASGRCGHLFYAICLNSVFVGRNDSDGKVSDHVVGLTSRVELTSPIPRGSQPQTCHRETSEVLHECSTRTGLGHTLHTTFRSLSSVQPSCRNLLMESATLSLFRTRELNTPLRKTVIWIRSSCWYLIWATFFNLIHFDLSMPCSESQSFCGMASPAAAWLSGTDAPLFGDGPRLCGLPFVVVDCALASVMLVWNALKESVGGAAMIGV